MGLVQANINEFLSYQKVLGLPILFKLDPHCSGAAWSVVFNKSSFSPPSAHLPLALKCSHTQGLGCSSFEVQNFLPDFNTKLRTLVIPCYYKYEPRFIFKYLVTDASSQKKKKSKTVIFLVIFLPFLCLPRNINWKGILKYLFKKIMHFLTLHDSWYMKFSVPVNCLGWIKYVA